MAVRSLKDGLERLRDLLMDGISVEGDTPEEKLRTLGIKVDLSDPVQEHLVKALYHGPNTRIRNKDLREAGEDLTHRGPVARRAKGLPESDEDFRKYLEELREWWVEQSQENTEKKITAYLDLIEKQSTEREITECLEGIGEE